MAPVVALGPLIVIDAVIGIVPGGLPEMFPIEAYGRFRICSICVDAACWASVRWRASVLVPIVDRSRLINPPETTAKIAIAVTTSISVMPRSGAARVVQERLTSEVCGTPSITHRPYRPGDAES